MLAQLLEDFPGEIRFIYRHFPLLYGIDGAVFHDKAGVALTAAEAAGIQGEFWAMHDLLYAKQSEWVEMEPEEFKEWLAGQAEEIGLDLGLFIPDLNGNTLNDYAEETYEFGIRIGLPGTPLLLINNRTIEQEFYSYTALWSTLEYWLIPLGRLTNQQFSECPEMTIDPDTKYVATLKTEKGDIEIALYSDIAPFTVNSFIFLAEHDFYDNVSFHRVIPGFMAQGGDPSGTGAGGPGYYFSLEVSSELLFDRPGLLAMANSGPTANGSQFFITYREAPELNGDFTIFGEVISGMDVVLALTPRNPQQGPSLPSGDLILDVIIEER